MFLKVVTKWSGELAIISAISLAWTTDIIGGLCSCCRVAIFFSDLIWRFLRNFVSPLVTCFLGGYLKFSDRLFCGCEQFLGKYSIWFLFSLVHDGEGIGGIPSLLCDRISFIAAFPYVLWARDNQIGVIEEVVSTFIRRGGLLSTYHIMWWLFKVPYAPCHGHMVRC